MSVLQDPRLERILASLQEESDAQWAGLTGDASDGDRRPDESEEEHAARVKAFLSDKMVALDDDKAQLCYLLCRALDARRVVEIGTSHGVSTLYLAAAVRDNVRAGGGEGGVIGTEYEPEKARAARANWERAGLSDFIELREGDLRQTLRTLEGPVDFMLMDIWTPMARPAVELVGPHLRQGAIVACDNTISAAAGYADYFAFMQDPANGFRSLTLPYAGGLQLSVRFTDRP
ncbi:MAG TPA: class I SAM-dependent methyltransferase [Candidatus Dormibacteraeota bacterium]|nr:class I SAM-dependent methyltransferase [Candidatus Dormibacteraeota bacterium]